MTQMADIVCCSCGIEFHVPKHWDQKRRSNHENLWCPNGHSLSYKGESAEERLRRENERLAQRIAQRDDAVKIARDRQLAAERSASAMKGVATRLRNRAAAGVCPCCNRSFVALARHIKMQHPNFAGDPVELKVITGGAA